MIFISLIVAGVLAGLLARAILGRPDRPEDAGVRGACGAFLAGGLAVGLASRHVGPLDPLALAAGVAGALALTAVPSYGSVSSASKRLLGR